jgi:hypothetical protein
LRWAWSCYLREPGLKQSVASLPSGVQYILRAKRTPDNRRVGANSEIIKTRGARLSEALCFPRQPSLCCEPWRRIP